MDVTPLIRRDAKIVQSYKNGAFKISGQVYTQPILVMVDRVVDCAFRIETLHMLQPDDFAFVKPYGVEVLLLGTGEKQILLPNSLRRAAKDQYGFTVESMDNGAAARTYNALMAEGRLVAAILI
jgi:uncharacterized protein